MVLLICPVSSTIRKEDSIDLLLTQSLFALDGRDSTETAGDLWTYVTHSIVPHFVANFRAVQTRQGPATRSSMALTTWPNSDEVRDADSLRGHSRGSLPAAKVHTRSFAAALDTIPRYLSPCG